jgi:hypothetical protein
VCPFCRPLQIWTGSLRAEDSSEGKICHYSEYGELTDAPCLCADKFVYYI